VSAAAGRAGGGILLLAIQTRISLIKVVESTLTFGKVLLHAGHTRIPFSFSSFVRKRSFQFWSFQPDRTSGQLHEQSVYSKTFIISICCVMMKKF
jgi:hypothetical protein